MSAPRAARFGIGQIICHRRLHYRGVVCDVDPVYIGSDSWYENVNSATSPKDRPWYYVLVHGRDHSTYVPEPDLELDPSGEPVWHPALFDIFDRMEEGAYVLRRNAH